MEWLPGYVFIGQIGGREGLRPDLSRAGDR
jgi:hypothetical protein